MPLHPVLADKLRIALQTAAPVARTRRDASLPAVPGKIHSVIGLRRAGKTTFLHQLRDEWRTSLLPERAIYIGFDDDRLADIGVEQLGLLLEEYFRTHPELRGRQTVHWFLDEIQLVPGWERFCRRVLDTERIELVVSGSSARMLSREVHTSLRGRSMATVIRPFGFREFLRHRGEEPAPGAIRPTPVERYRVTQVEALRWLVRQCLRNPAGSMSVHRLHLDLRAQGHGVAKDAVHAMLGHLTDAFLLTAVTLATESERQRNSNPRKIYPADPGLIVAFDRSGRANLGHVLETVVLNELERRGAEIGYVKTEAGLEVDFLARHSGAGEELIQVCADVSDPATLERELRALDAAGREHRRAAKRLLVLSRDDVPHVQTRGVEIQPAYEWLLALSASP